MKVYIKHDLYYTDKGITLLDKDMGRRMVESGALVYKADGDKFVEVPNKYKLANMIDCISTILNIAKLSILSDQDASDMIKDVEENIKRLIKELP